MTTETKRIEHPLPGIGCDIHGRKISAEVTQQELSLDCLIYAVLQWGIDRQITGPNGKGTIAAQASKLREEANEVMDEIEMMDSGDSLNPVKLEIGDVFVSAILLCDMLHLTPEQCLQSAYEKISKRDGQMIDGTFVRNVEPIHGEKDA